MRYLEALQSQITPLINFYLETLEEAITDVNKFLDRHLESDFISNLVISGIVAVPLVGSLFFVWVLMLSA